MPGSMHDRQVQADGTSTIVSASFRIRMPSAWLPVSARCRAIAFDECGRVTRIVAMLTEIRELDAIRQLQSVISASAFHGRAWRLHHAGERGRLAATR